MQEGTVNLILRSYCPLHGDHGETLQIRLFCYLQELNYVMIWYHANGVLIVCDRVRPAGESPLCRGLQPEGSEPIRQDKALPGGDCPGLPQCRPGMEDHPAEVLQPHRRPRERRDRGGSQGHSQQPAALHPAGRRGQAPRAQRLRLRLSHQGRHRGGLHTCNDVMDLADGHIAALEKLFATPDIGCVAYNLRTGRGTTVLEMLEASGKEIPIKKCPRRPGDSEEVYASTEKAEKELDWRAQYRIEEMCRDQWNWAKKNPYGYCGNVEKKD